MNTDVSDAEVTSELVRTRQVRHPGWHHSGDAHDNRTLAQTRAVSVQPGDDVISAAVVVESLHAFVLAHASKSGVGDQHCAVT